MEKMKDAIDAIKEIAEEGGIVVWNPMNLKINKYDKVALELMEQLQDYSFGETIEILQTTIFWVILLSSTNVADKEIEKGKVKGIVLKKNEKS